MACAWRFLCNPLCLPDALMADPKPAPQSACAQEESACWRRETGSTTPRSGAIESIRSRGQSQKRMTAVFKPCNESTRPQIVASQFRVQAHQKRHPLGFDSLPTPRGRRDEKNTHQRWLNLSVAMKTVKPGVEKSNAPSGLIHSIRSITALVDFVDFYQATLSNLRPLDRIALLQTS